MIGYYVHHVGRGHLHRATALARALDDEVTGLSSLPEPADWRGAWVHLDRDDDGDAQLGTEADVTAGGRLHWAPRGHPGLRRRTAQLSAWIEQARPDLVVVDLSVEVLLLARLHGVPVIGVVLPGVRDDAAHRLGLDVADALAGFWPPEASTMLRGVPAEVVARVRPVGALSRFPVADAAARRAAGGRRVVLMLGAGGHDVRPDDVERARAETPGWTWTVLGGEGGWVEDPDRVLAAADVVVTHAGQNAIAETAAARVPAVVLPQRRPHDEQATTGAVLAAGGWPVLVEDAWPGSGWAARLERAAALDGARWAAWCDGGAAARFAAVVDAVRG